MTSYTTQTCSAFQLQFRFGGGTHGAAENGSYVAINPADLGAVETTEGEIGATLARIVAHELGGILDDRHRESGC